MAPRKRKADQAEAVAAQARVTRSSTRRAAESNSAKSVRESPKPEKRGKKKAEGAEKKEKKLKVESEENAAAENGVEEEALGVVDGETEKNVVVGGEKKKKTVVIEHCKQCNSFKTRALQVKEGLEKDVPGITVEVNPDKPRRGCFEIREKGGETFISLLELKRPFKPMKDLDMNQVIDDIIGKIK